MKKLLLSAALLLSTPFSAMCMEKAIRAAKIARDHLKDLKKMGRRSKKDETKNFDSENSVETTLSPSGISAHLALKNKGKAKPRQRTKAALKAAIAS